MGPRMAKLRKIGVGGGEFQKSRARRTDGLISGKTVAGLDEERMQALVHFNFLKFLNESKSFSPH